jgi:tRNA (cytidine/uridine-2'-O-)-methyltransferase
MFHIVLFEPEIPPNTGNIIRLCANTGSILHLIKPLGFTPTDSKLKRAGLDYHDWAKVQIHENFQAFCNTVQPQRLFVCETGEHTQLYTDPTYQIGDAFLFGPETRGLSAPFLQQVHLEQLIKVPMVSATADRSLNLANCVAIVVFEAWRQVNFAKPAG